MRTRIAGRGQSRCWPYVFPLNHWIYLNQYSQVIISFEIVSCLRLVLYPIFSQPTTRGAARIDFSTLLGFNFWTPPVLALSDLPTPAGFPTARGAARIDFSILLGFHFEPHQCWLFPTFHPRWVLYVPILSLPVYWIYLNAVPPGNNLIWGYFLPMANIILLLFLGQKTKTSHHQPQQYH